MAFRIIVAVAIGGGIGLAVGYISHSLGGQCPILCNPYVSTGLGVIIALYVASQSGAAAPATLSESLVRIDSEPAFRQAIRDSGGMMLVEFYTDYCPACRRQLPVMGALADRFAGRATIAVANAQRLPSVSEREEIQAVPTMILYVNGRPMERLVGLRRERELAELIEKHLPAEQDARSGT